MEPPNPPTNPIFVTGTPRSGKSVICRMLTREPEFQWVREPLMIWDTDLGPRSDDCRTAEEATPELSARIQKACTELLENPQHRYVDDLSYHALRIPFLFEVMPNAKIVHVVRDAEQAIPEMLYGWTNRDSVGKAFARRRKSIRLQGLPRMAARFVKNYISSRVKGSRQTWGPRVPGLAEYVASHAPAEVAAFQWKSMVEIAMDELTLIPTENWIQVHFDRLLKDPHDQALRIGEFCEVQNPEKFAEEATNFIDPNFIFEKKVFPTDAEWVTIHPMIEAVCQRIAETDSN